MMRLMRARIAYRAEPVDGKYRGHFWANTTLILIQAQPPEGRKTPG